MAAESVEMEARQLSRAERRRQRKAERATGSGADEGAVREPDEPVVFLTPWNRYGLDRLYVIDELGVEGGYLDLQSGAAVEVAERAGPILEQLRPHYTPVTPAAPADATVEGAGAGDSSADTSTSPTAATDATPSAPAPSKRRRRRRSPDAEAASGEPALLAGRQVLDDAGQSRLVVHRVVGGQPAVELGWFDLRDGSVHADERGAVPVVRWCGQKYLRVGHPAG